MTTDWVPVVSSNLLRVRYFASDGWLDIDFDSGGTYRYYDVPLEVYQALLAAPSKGRYHAAAIKWTYRFARL